MSRAGLEPAMCSIEGKCRAPNAAGYHTSEVFLPGSLAGYQRRVPQISYSHEQPPGDPHNFLKDGATHSFRRRCPHDRNSSTRLRDHRVQAGRARVVQNQVNVLARGYCRANRWIASANCGFAIRGRPSEVASSQWFDRAEEVGGSTALVFAVAFGKLARLDTGQNGLQNVGRNSEAS